MTSCHDVKHRLYSISACRSAREMTCCFYSFTACLVWKLYRVCVCMMSWRHDVTSWCHKKLTFPILNCRCSKVMIHMYFCRYFGCWVPSYCVLAWCLHVITWRHDVIKITTWRQETNCLHISLQMCSRADSISFLWFLRWLNSTWLLSSYLHDGISSRNDVMTSLNTLYLSQLVDVLERWFFFVSIVLWGEKFKNIIDSVSAYVVMS